ncbi:MAG TPA: YfdX family protein [Bryobacteraceae bacterium]
MVIIIIGIWLSYGLGCSRSAREEKDSSSGAEASSSASSRKSAERQKTTGQKAEAKSAEAKSVEPQVQSEIGKMEADKRANLLKDAESALEETRNALTALDKGDKNAALAALERASGKLDLVVSRDPKLAFAPVDVATSVLDLYATPDTVKAVIKEAKDDLSNNRVQQARQLVTDLASEADTSVIEIPLATYPAAIKAVAPLIDAGKTDEAKAALNAALNTLVIETYVVPLPRVRAQAMLRQAEHIAAKSNRTQDDNQKARSFIEATRTQLQLAETLGYGTKSDYKPLYAQLDDIQKKAENGQSGRGLFAKVQQSLKNFKFSS